MTAHPFFLPVKEAGVADERDDAQRGSAHQVGARRKRRRPAWLCSSGGRQPGGPRAEPASRPLLSICSLQVRLSGAAPQPHVVIPCPERGNRRLSCERGEASQPLNPAAGKMNSPGTRGLSPRSKSSLFAEDVLGPNPVQAHGAVPPPPRGGGRAFTSPRLEIFYTILNWGIQRCSALDYCAPEKL